MANRLELKDIDIPHKNQEKKFWENRFVLEDLQRQREGYQIVGELQREYAVKLHRMLESEGRDVQSLRNPSTNQFRIYVKQ